MYFFQQCGAYHRCRCADAISFVYQIVVRGCFAWAIGNKSRFPTFIYPILGLGVVGPYLGLALGALSVVFIVKSMRRFFAAEHKWRWGYASIGIVLIIVVIVQSAFDITALAS